MMKENKMKKLKIIMFVISELNRDQSFLLFKLVILEKLLKISVRF